MKKIILILFFGIFTFGFSQNNQRLFKKLSINKNNLELKVSDGKYYIALVNNSIVEIIFVPNGEKQYQNSHSKVAQNINYDYKKVKENDNFINLKHENIEVKITKKPFQISYYFENKEIISEKRGYYKQKHQALEHVKGNIIADSTEVLQFNITHDEVLFGGGSRALGMNRRGNKLALYNRASYGYENKAELMNFCIPMVLSSKLYAIHFDNPAIGYLDLDSKTQNLLEYETISGRKAYQVIFGKSWENIIENYVFLTGKQPLPPRWSLGNFSSRFGYHSQEQVERTIQKFQDEKIPVDAIILDLYWFGKTIKGTMGNLDWDKDNFPNPEKMISDLNAKGVKTIVITEPFILTTSSKWQETVDKKVLATLKNGQPATWDFYFGNTGIVDVFKPEGKDWFWNIYKKLINQGVAGLWGDLGEPEVFPSYANTFTGTADEVHNIYGHQWAKLIADGYQKEYTNQRPFILMRSGYSGTQRFGMIPWSGDVNRSWGGLQSQTEIALQMGLQGMAYMHSDLGGFAGDYYDNELYLRWLQYGVFNPIFRPHAQEEVASEVVYKDIETKAIAKKAVELRYQLLTYNYNLAFENSQSGIPLMRPLFFEEPENKALYTKSDGYFWGNNFLIYPIVTRGQEQKEVYFPKTANWFDFYTDKKHTAGSTQNITLNKNNIPTYVRGGSFVPINKIIQNTENFELNDFELHYYFDESVKTTHQNIYNDDGKTPNNFEKNKFEIININSNLNNQSLVIKIGIEKALNNLKNKKIKLILHEFYNNPSTINFNKKILKNNEYQYENNILSVEINCENNKTNEIEIKF